MFPSRSSGLLLHPTSLPGPGGIGTLGAGAHRFLRVLRAMRQSVWQILPFGPTGYGDSPYQGLSTFAGNPLWIDPDLLVRDGLLSRPERRAMPRLPAGHVDFGRLIPAREALLRTVAETFARRADAGMRAAADAFFECEHEWIEDYALFAALKQAQRGKPWTAWPADLARRRPTALREARRRHARAIANHRVIQFLFHRQWAGLREAARRAGVHILGDVPLFVAHDSADVWARPDLFLLDAKGLPRVVAGVPPDYFSPTGQRWGNPVYDWGRHAEDGFAWWIRRLRRSLDLVDSVRLDHFRGFAQYWSIPAPEPTAERGQWVDGPGAALFEALSGALGGLPLVAEDLGHITPDVHALRDAFALPGMRVLPFTLDELLADPDALLAEGPEQEVFYSGTHDNDTLIGWLSGARQGVKTAGPGDERTRLLNLVPGHQGEAPHRGLVELVLRSRARLTIFPVQDILGMDSGARMNRPGTSQGNWQWRLRKGQITPALMDWLAQATVKSVRG